MKLCWDIIRTKRNEGGREKKRRRKKSYAKEILIVDLFDQIFGSDEFKTDWSDLSTTQEQKNKKKPKKLP